MLLSCQPRLFVVVLFILLVVVRVVVAVVELFNMQHEYFMNAALNKVVCWQFLLLQSASINESRRRHARCG